jgi:hypothetical protein
MGHAYYPMLQDSVTPDCHLYKGVDVEHEG